MPPRPPTIRPRARRHRTAGAQNVHRRAGHQAPEGATEATKAPARQAATPFDGRAIKARVGHAKDLAPLIPRRAALRARRQVCHEPEALVGVDVAQQIVEDRVFGVRRARWQQHPPCPARAWNVDRSGFVHIRPPPATSRHVFTRGTCARTAR